MGHTAVCKFLQINKKEQLRPSAGEIVTGLVKVNNNVKTLSSEYSCT